MLVPLAASIATIKSHLFSKKINVTFSSISILGFAGAESNILYYIPDQIVMSMII